MPSLTKINIVSWSSRQVCNWMGGLEDVLQQYVPSFERNDITGKKLLVMDYEDMERVGVTKLGHQELLFDAIEHLNKLQHCMDNETLQSIALNLSCLIRGLLKEFEILQNSSGGHEERRKLSTPVYYGISQFLHNTKYLLSWLDRPPFKTMEEFKKIREVVRKRLTQVMLNVQTEVKGLIQDREKLENDLIDELSRVDSQCWEMIRDITEPLIIQPVWLELATIRKKPEDELGMHIQSSYCGTHTISGVKDDAPAYMCGKVDEGDEVLQVNNHVVVGWQLARLVDALKENNREVVLMLKKRPCYMHTLATHMKKKRKHGSGNKTTPSTLPKSFKRKSRKSRKLQEVLEAKPPETVASVSGIEEVLAGSVKEAESENDITDDVFRSGSESPGDFSQLRTYEDVKQRRATVSGGSPTIKNPTITVSESDTPPSKPQHPAPRPKSYINPNMLMGHFSFEIASNGSVLQRSDATTLSAGNNPENSPPEDQEFEVSEFSMNVPVFPAVDPKQSEESAADEDKSLEELTRHLHLMDTEKADQTTESSSTQELLIDSEKTPEVSGNETLTNLFAQCQHKCEGIVADANPEASPQLVGYKRITSLQRDQLSGQDQEELDKLTDLPFSATQGLSEGSTSRPESVVTSYTVNIIGGIPVKTTTQSPMSNQTGSPAAPPSLLRQKKTPSKPSAAKRANRRVSCKDLGKSDCEGWLYKRKDKTPGRGLGRLAGNWAKRWCVLKDFSLYWYKDREDEQAQGLIYLPGFLIAPVMPGELKNTKKFAFKAFHSGTTFYFASDRRDDMAKWMNKMGVSSISFDLESEWSTVAGFTPVTESSLVLSNPSVKFQTDSLANSPCISESEDSDTTLTPSLCEQVENDRDASSTLRTHDSDASSALRTASTLTVAPEDVTMSQDDLHRMATELHRQEIIPWTNRSMRKKRHSHLVGEVRVSESGRKQVELHQRLNTLQRTLESYEQELKAIDTLLSSSSITSEMVHTFKRDYLESPHGSESSLDTQGEYSQQEGFSSSSDDGENEEPSQNV